MLPKDLTAKFQNDFDALKMDIKEQYLRNASILCARVSELLSAYGQNPWITSGWRPISYNLQIGGSISSKHITCQAVDLSDPDKTLGQWCVSNVERLKEIGLYMESLSKTHASDVPIKRWVHLTTVAPKSGNTIFEA